MKRLLAWIVPERALRFAVDHNTATVYTVVTIHDVSRQFLRDGAALGESVMRELVS